MKKIRFLSIFLLMVSLALLWNLTSCRGQEPADADGENFEQVTFAVPENTEMVFLDGMMDSAYGADSSEGSWLAGCSASDRDDQFDAYTLRCETAENGNITFTYLIYYPHGGDSLTATPELLEVESGYVINLSYGAGTGIKGYSLCYLSVTLPTDDSPRVRLLVNGDSLGVLSTVTESTISVGKAKG